jgi:glycosyltransferase involved in cell wall biosynthesis
MKILYLAPLLPAPSGNGGKRAIYNHLEDMLDDDAEITAFFVDVEAAGEPDLRVFARFDPQVFDRAVAKFGDGWKGKAAAISTLLFSNLPRSLAVVASPVARARIAAALAQGEYDAVIVDHLNAFSLIRGLKLIIPVIYVAHNVESEVLRQAAVRLPTWSLRRMIADLDHARMRRVEREMLTVAAKVAVIGAGDMAHPVLSSFSGKVVVWPELPQLKIPLWSNPKSKKLLFVGSAKYFPNMDAISWLVHTLMPALLSVDSGITLDIAGTKADELQLDDNPPGVTFHGFVSDARLDELHREANLFICPVVLGAGIKIKMLEAASYGLPSAATDESLLGIDFLTSLALRIDRNAPNEAAGKIAAAFRDQEGLSRISAAGASALAETISTRASLLDHVRAADVGLRSQPG